jgi:serine phosphatase RsbU (regulator of sigma subunit)
MGKGSSGSYVVMCCISKEQSDYVRSNGYKPSQILQASIDIMRGEMNPLYFKLIEGLAKQLREGKRC